MLLNLMRLWFGEPMCHKQMLGYNCKHGVHQNVKECDGSRILPAQV